MGFDRRVLVFYLLYDRQVSKTEAQGDAKQYYKVNCSRYCFDSCYSFSLILMENNGSVDISR